MCYILKSRTIEEEKQVEANKAKIKNEKKTMLVIKINVIENI